MAVQPAMHICRQTKSIMCMHMLTHPQNVFADRGNELKRALFDRRLLKELDLLQSIRQGKANILRFAPNGHEPESELFLSFVASQTPGPPNPRFDMDTDERKGNDPGARRNETESIQRIQSNNQGLRCCY
jgi:hypothetical protein